MTEEDCKLQNTEYVHVVSNVDDITEDHYYISVKLV